MCHDYAIHITITLPGFFALESNHWFSFQLQPMQRHPASAERIAGNLASPLHALGRFASRTPFGVKLFVLVWPKCYIFKAPVTPVFQVKVKPFSANKQTY
jgi:hypothetical protein